MAPSASGCVGVGDRHHVEGVGGRGGVGDVGLHQDRVGAGRRQRQPAAVAAEAGAEQEVAVGVDQPPVVAAAARESRAK